MSHVASDDNTEILYHRSQQRNFGQSRSSTSSPEEETSSPVVQSNLTQSETNKMLGSEHGENSSTENDKTDPLREMLKLLQQNPNKAKQDVSKYAYLTVLDFAGQYAFYTTHQMFLTRRAIYLLVSDASKDVSDLVEDECYFDSEGIMKCKVHDLVEIWMNSIHSCAQSDMENLNSANSHTSSYKVIPPPVILVGTHIDQIPQNLPRMVDNYGGQIVMPDFPCGNNPGPTDPIQYDVQGQRNLQSMVGNYGSHSIMPGFPGGNNPGLRNLIQYGVQAQMKQPTMFDKYQGHIIRTAFPAHDNTSPRHPIQYDMHAQRNQRSMIGNYGGQSAMLGFPGGNNPGPRNPMQYHGQAQWNQPSMFDNYGGHIVRPGFSGGINTGPRNPIQYDVQAQRNQPSIFSNYGGQIVMPGFLYSNNPGPRNPIPYAAQAQLNQPNMAGTYGVYNLMPCTPYGNNLCPSRPIQHDVQTPRNQLSMVGNYGSQMVMPGFPGGSNSGPRNYIQYDVQAQRNLQCLVGNYGDHIVRPGFPGGINPGPRNLIQYDVQAEWNQTRMVGSFGGVIVRPAFDGGNNPILRNPIESDEYDESDERAPSDYRHECGQRYLMDIRSYLKDKPTVVHLVDEDFAIDNTVVDSRLEKLKKKIVEVASQQPYWGEQIPTRWFLLEQQLMRLRDAGVKVISHSAVEDLNKEGTVQIKESEELDLFLRYLHETGTIIYFSMEILRDNIVLDPKWMIDALKSLINAHPDLPNSPADSTVTQKWSDFRERGILTSELVDALWTKEKHPELHAHKDHILLILEQLNIIARPRSFSEIGEKVENYFVTPCMLRQESPREVLSTEQDSRMESTPVLCFVFRGKFLPPPIFHRLLAACVARWPVAKKKDTSEYLIFCGCCVFDLDLYHRLTLHCRNHIVFARITRMVIDEVKTLDAKLCTRVRKFLALNLSKITSCLGQNLQYDLHLQYPPSLGVTVNGMVCFSPPFQMWIADEGHDPDAPITPEHMNHARLCVALVTVCGNALREILLSHVPAPYTNIYQAIRANKANLTNKTQTRRGQWQNALLIPDQCHVVFPDPFGRYVASVDQFDISLLYILIRNVSTTPAPVLDWGFDPIEQPQRDRSLGASVLRIRSYRNQIGHSMDGKMNQEDFEDYWNKIDAVLDDIEHALGRQGYRAQLEKQKRQVISIYDAC